MGVTTTTDATLAEQPRAYAVKLWDESRALPGGTRARVEAYVVPFSGVGWVDCKWAEDSARLALSTPHMIKISPEERRLLADWNGQDQSIVVRQVIVVADGWFAHCNEIAERELAVVALAAEERARGPKGPTGPTGASGPTRRTGSVVTGTGASGVTPPRPPNQKQMLQELQDQMEEMRRRGGGVLGGAGPTGPPAASLPAPSTRDEAIEDVLLSFAGEAVVGATESTSDGLSDPGDHVAKPYVGR